MENSKEIKAQRNTSRGNNKILFTIISILLGLIVGAIVLLISGYNPLEAYKALIEGVSKSPRNVGWAIVNSTPIILTGLGVCFAFKTGLFNMGAEGQFIIGSIVGYLIGYALPLPIVIHPIVAILLAMLAGALYGALAGFIKSKFGIHEVISTIMLNWIAFYFSNFVAYKYLKPNSMATFDVNDTAKITLVNKKAAKNMGPFFSKFFKAPIHWGIILAIVAVIIVWYILNKTVLGYELKAVGLNREASEYGGINAGKKIVQSMTISGAICALAGATQILGFTYSISVTSAMDNYGFDGLAVSLLASNNPIGVIFSGLFFGSLKYAGSNLQRVLGVPSELINIIIGTIILFTAVPLIFRIIRAKRRNRRLKNTGVKDIKEENFNEKASLTSTREEKDKNDLSANYGKEKKLLSNNESSSNIINETGEDITIRTIESEQE
jgi:inner-membrane translocator